jgi:hypothetical protein
MDISLSAYICWILSNERVLVPKQYFTEAERTQSGFLYKMKLSQTLPFVPDSKLDRT